MARSYVTVRRRRRTLLLRVGKEKMQKKKANFFACIFFLKLFDFVYNLS